MAREFFKGTTQAGRTLILYFEHTAYDTFTDATGEVVHNPSETEITGTLDGEPIGVDGLSWSGQSAVVRSRDHGTFTATNSEYADDHHEALRRYLERKPSGGWEVSVVDAGKDGDYWRYGVTITNGRLTERAEFRLSERVASTVARGGSVPPSHEAVEKEIANSLRLDDWVRIQSRAAHPTTIEWIDHPAA